MAERNDDTVALNDARFRRIDKRFDVLTGRVEDTIGVLTRLVRVVAAQNDRMNRNFAKLSKRITQMTRAVLRGRTQDAQRLSRAERRLDLVERRLTVLERRR